MPAVKTRKRQQLQTAVKTRKRQQLQTAVKTRKRQQLLSCPVKEEVKFLNISDGTVYRGCAGKKNPEFSMYDSSFYFV